VFVVVNVKGLNLGVLFSLLEETPAYSQLLEGIGKNAVKATILESAKPYLIAALHRKLKIPIILVTAQPEEAKRLYEQILAWETNPLFFFAEPDALPYERLSPDFTTTQERLTALGSLGATANNNKPPLIVAPAWAIAQKTIPAKNFQQVRQTLVPGLKIELIKLLQQWQRMGYQMEDSVEVPGTASRRGGILDIFPIGMDKPVRIELFGEYIESIRFFDPATQRSQQKVDSVELIPAREMLIPHISDDRNGNEILESLRVDEMPAEGKERFTQEITSLLQEQWFPAQEFYAPLFSTDTILDYLGTGGLIVWNEPADIKAALSELETRATELRQQRQSSGELPPGFPLPYFTWTELCERSGKLVHQLELSRWEGVEQEKETITFNFTVAPSYGGQWTSFLKGIKQSLQSKQVIVIVSQQAQRISEILQENDIIAPPLSALSQFPPPGTLSLVSVKSGQIGSLGEGWVMNNVETSRQVGTVSLLTDNEIFSFVKQRRLVKRHPVRRQPFLSELKVGEYVVHIDHGIARFSGMVQIGTGIARTEDKSTETPPRTSGEREYLILEYANGDKLYVPTDQVDRISRYIGPGGAIPALSRLATQEWQRTRQRVKEATEVIAKDLLELYASREVLSGTAFSQDTIWQQEMEAAFPYVETPDQLEAILEVKEDMEKPKPMDRLVCGDVGYGKTEVALRAAFKAVMDGRQVAVLVPTTVLAQQHLNTFSQRLTAFPIKVEMLSRFRSPKEQHEIVARLKEGAIDICIGTHRLLQKDISFKNLGLVVIDEEQRFGVAHKERLKQMRKEVDVLTLSATPIPRTLHMSLVGVRDMSTMETPPEERLPIKTYVAEYDERLIREAILRELERNGQVFFVHNRVQTMGRIVQRLKEIVPEARISTGHGQMPEEELERVMGEFAEGKNDVLVCSTIIESGLDMPNVNTLIINDADKFGLTQLYQLRGRVGRGAHRAYAYFLYTKGKSLTETAQKRLETIYEATELGAGFRIAMKDLEIRGAGNLLGVEQSGQIGAVGFDLYCQMLAEAVEGMKAKIRGEVPRPTSHLPPPTIDLPLPAHIPGDYINDVSSRLAFYLRLTKVTTNKEIDDIVQELKDRFGAPPPEVENLLYIVKIKLIAMRAGISSIASEEGEIVLRMREGLKINRFKLGVLPAGVNISPTQIRLDLKRLGNGWRGMVEGILNKMAG